MLTDNEIVKAIERLELAEIEGLKRNLEEAHINIKELQAEIKKKDKHISDLMKEVRKYKEFKFALKVIKEMAGAENDR